VKSICLTLALQYRRHAVLTALVNAEWRGRSGSVAERFGRQTYLQATTPSAPARQFGTVAAAAAL